jgi:hypothetical protein
MVGVSRKWNCRNCGRSNKTVVHLDATVTCEYCTVAMKWPGVSAFRASLSRLLRGVGQARRPAQARDQAPAGSLPNEPGVVLGKESLSELDRSRKGLALALLRERYHEARELVPAQLLNANLEWILGKRKLSTRDAANLNRKMIGLVEVWLQDLAGEVDRTRPDESSGGSECDAGAMSADRARRSVAQCLRDATESFVVASRLSF